MEGDPQREGAIGPDGGFHGRVFHESNANLRIQMRFVITAGVVCRAIYGWEGVRYRRLWSGDL